MESLSTPPWRLRLGALALGFLIIAGVVGLDMFISSDLRLVYIVDAILLFCVAVWFGRKGRDWIAAAFLVLPSLAGFVFYLLNIPALWPNDVLWVAAVAVGFAVVDLARSRRGVLLALVAGLLIASGWYCVSYVPNQLAKMFTRTKQTSAPAFTLVPLTDRAPTGATPGKILLIDFFSTVCSPCIAELPEMIALRSDLGRNDDIELVLVGSDQFVGNDTPERFREFAQKRHLTLPLAFDSGKKAHDSFGVRGVPCLVIIDRQGRVRFTHEGYNPAEANFRSDLVQFIKTLD